MNVEQFLARVVGPGAYMAIAFKDPSRPGGMGHRFFPRDKVGEAVGFLDWTYTHQISDAYFGLAGFDASTGAKIDAQGRPLEGGLRTAANAEGLTAFWLDLDVARLGDGKDPSQVYATRLDALQWLLSFVTAAKIPKPNLYVDSGYGYHVYWTLEDGLTRAEWQPYADALKAAMLEYGYIGDLQRVCDAASILRPPGSLNRKGGGAAPVTVVDALTKSDYPNQVMLDALQPYVGQGATTTVVAPFTLGPMPAHIAAMSATHVVPNMTAAAQAGVQSHRSASFARIATKCLQVQHSMTSHGAGDQRPLWYLGFLSLAHHCTDGAQFAHEISNGHHKYTPAEVDKSLQEIAKAKLTKDFGPPRCTTFDKCRPGVCDTCPLKGKIGSPWVLGKDVGDLPENYRRERGWLEAKIKAGDDYKWVRMLEGDVYIPSLDRLPGGAGYALNFTYEFAGRQFPVRVEEPNMPGDSAFTSLFTGQNVALLERNAKIFKEFIVAWIQHMRRGRLERDEIIRPFGYATDVQGERTGLAVGGMLYRPDGTSEPAAGGDPKVVAAYVPNGKRAPWRHAFDLVCPGRIDLQILVAVAFGAPLMIFTGEHGLVFSGFSPQSASGKSSAIKVGNAVWADPTQIISLNPTYNSLMEKLGQIRNFPCYWDEMSWGKEDKEVVQALMNVSQGTSKARLDSNMHQREVLTWQTLMVVAGNAPVMDAVSRGAAFTDATALRMLEFSCEPPAPTVVPGVAAATTALKIHYGHVGQEFAAHVAANMSLIEQQVLEMIEKLNAKWEATRAERLYIAGIAAVMIGAYHANTLGLTSFDIKGIREFFHAAVLRSRDQRSGLIANEKGYDVGRVLAEFQTDHISNILVTKKFIRRGPRPADWEPAYRSPGPGVAPCYVHYSVEDQRSWVNKSVLMDWLRRKGYAPSSVLTDMKRAWDTSEARRVIGAGTSYAAGQLPVIEIPMSDPRMAHLIPMFEINNEQIARLALPEEPEEPAPEVAQETQTPEAA